MDMTYQVVRRLNNYKVGTILTDADFVAPYRIAQLIDQRYIVPLGSRRTQPTVSALLGASVRQVKELVLQVQDACVLEAALAQETRESAQQTLEKRLQEVSNGVQTQ